MQWRCHKWWKRLKKLRTASADGAHVTDAEAGDGRQASTNYVPASRLDDRWLVEDADTTWLRTGVAKLQQVTNDDDDDDDDDVAYNLLDR